MRLDLVVGPNGAGKTTFVELVLAPCRPGVTFVNADVIAAQQWPQSPHDRSYDAARIAAATRDALIERRVPFIAETVFSHPSKLELIERATAAGYTVALQVLLIPEVLAVARVTARVNAGGHSVPENKIRSRYVRLWPLVARAVTLCTTATVYDNSRRDGPQEVASFASGLTSGIPRWPEWTPHPLRRLAP